MQANTKLTPEQKSLLKIRKAQNPDVRLVNLDNRTVMAYKPMGNTVEFSLSVMAPTEKKFRVKVGEFYALEGFLRTDSVKMQIHDFIYMCETVWDAYPMSE